MPFFVQQNKFIAFTCFGSLGLLSCSHKDGVRNISKINESESSMKNSNDPYIWLEEVESEKSLKWAKEQNEKTFERLKGDPRFEVAETELLKIFEDPEKIPNVTLRGDYAYNFWRDAEHVQGVYRRTTLAEYRKPKTEWEILIDFDQLSKDEGKTWVFDGTECLAPNYEFCMVRMSNGGSDASISREFNLVSKKFVTDNAFYVPESKHHFAWKDENTLLIGANFGPDSLTDSGYPRTSRVWKRGTAIDKSELKFEGNKEDVSVYTWRSSNSAHKFSIFDQAVDFYNSNVFILFDDESEVKKLNKPTDVNVVGVKDSYLFLQNRKAWKTPQEWGVSSEIPAGSLIALEWSAIQSGNYVGKLSLVWSPQKRVSLNRVHIAQSGLILDVSHNVKSEAYFATTSVDQVEGLKWNIQKLELPENGSLSFSSVRYNSDEFIYGFENFLIPESTYLYNVSTFQGNLLKSKKSYFDARPFVVEQFEARSRDGEKIPYFVVRPKNFEFDGSHPTIMYGYGGFEVSMNPYYSATVGTQWLQKGGVYVLTNIRGGGEFGPEWHQAALKENRQVAYDDFHSIAEDLIARKITSSSKLAIEGGSNGGLLVGVAFTQRPDLYKAVSCAVPLLDMMRFHKLLAGASWMGEYGNPDKPEEAEYISKYSPYQNVYPNVKYPEVYFFTSTKDDRVHPAHARKMVARMMEQGHPVLYYENIEGGHGGAANLKQSATQQAMKYVYYWQKLMDTKY